MTNNKVMVLLSSENTFHQRKKKMDICTELESIQKFRVRSEGKDEGRRRKFHDFYQKLKSRLMA